MQDALEEGDLERAEQALARTEALSARRRL
eukprot:COSAG01_NODE_59574_length_299_cov_1.290000_1_plen_29_part_10